MSKGKLYLIPSLIGDASYDKSIPEYNVRITGALRYFIVENEKSARRFIKIICPDVDLRSLELFPLNEHTPEGDLPSYLSPASQGHDIGLLSEAGCPCVADPGATIVRLAHTMGIRVVPLVGPSSILLSLMASGMNGQNFTFHGYLPVKEPERGRKITDIERIAQQSGGTQIFIETPYRNNKLIDEIVRRCHSSSRLCVAMDIGTDQELIVSKPIPQWKTAPVDCDKRPAIFLLYKE
jgi:16S rRNA (cytidine1402-2'-O)-methyltransferase